MKRFFDSPKKAVLSIICIVAAVLIILAAVSAIGIRNSLISKSEAGSIALKDAGLSESEASALRIKLDFDDGYFQYDVEFYNDGTEYEYVIWAKNGEIMGRSIEGDRVGNNQEQSASSNQGNQSDSSDSSDLSDSTVNDPDQKEQPVSDENDAAQAQETTNSVAQADDAAQAQETTNSVAQVENTAQAQETTNSAAQADDIAGSNGDNTGNNYIGVERAKEIALNHAGMSETDVQFIKAKLEKDDGKMEYEIEFYFNRTEYDYTIDAVSGDILEFDVDAD